MSDTEALDAKVYAASEKQRLSMRDLLGYFSKSGSLRTSDLHLKVRSPPVYRVDGEMQQIKGAPLDRVTVEKLARSILSDSEWASLRDDGSVDTSHVGETMQILNNTYALANLIRLAKIEQIYSQLQTKTRDVPEERMTTLERSLAGLVHKGAVTALEAEKWATHRSAFLDELQRRP